MLLKTQRLILRPFQDRDFEAYSNLMAHPDVMKFSVSGPITDKAISRELFQKRILDHYAQYGYGLYAVILPSTQELIGYVGFLTQCIAEQNNVELGYRFFPDYWGKGFATEAALAVCQYAFDQLQIDELISIIDPKNIPSLRLAKRIGMKFSQEASFHDIPVHIYHLVNPSPQPIVIRNLQEEDIERLAHTFQAPWSDFAATKKLWKRYFAEQQEGIRTACVLEKGHLFLGYGSLLRSSEYPFFRDNEIPEVNAIWIDESNRKQGLGTRLIAHLEALARQEGYKIMGIGVGLYRDYGPAQKLYFKLGYSPDGNGMTYKCSPVVPGEAYPVDDDLVFWLTKKI